MCRHLGYLGPAVGVGDVLTRGSHSLVVQSWAPTDMRCSAVANADGFGVHVPKGYIYAAMAFSTLVEVLNMLSRRGKSRAA